MTKSPTATLHALVPRLARAMRFIVPAFLVAASLQPAVATAGTGSEAPGAPYKRVLVVGISPDEKLRCRFERFLAAKINSEHTKSVASCDAVTKVDPLTRESIQEAVDWLKVDAVVATSLVNREWTTEEGGGGRDTRGTAGYKATDAGVAYGYYGMYGVPVIYGEFVATPAVTTLSGTVHLTTKVFATKGPTLVYTLDTKVKKQDWADRSYSGVTTPITKELRRAGLVQ